MWVLCCLINPTAIRTDMLVSFAHPIRSSIQIKSCHRHSPLAFSISARKSRLNNNVGCQKVINSRMKPSPSEEVVPNGPWYMVQCPNAQMPKCPMPSIVIRAAL